LFKINKTSYFQKKTEQPQRNLNHLRLKGLQDKRTELPGARPQKEFTQEERGQASLTSTATIEQQGLV